MDVDSSLKECPISKVDDGQKSQSEEPKPLEDSVAVSSACLSPGNQSKVLASVAPDSDEQILQNISAESQEMQVEKMKENPEDSPCTAVRSLQSESDGERVGVNRATLITAESQLSAEEECTSQINVKAQCNAGHEVPNADYNDAFGQGSEPVQQVIIPEACPDEEDKSVQRRSEVKANGAAYSLQVCVTPQTCSMTEPESTVEEIPSVPTPVVTTTDLKMAEDQNGYDGQDSESSCTRMNGASSGDSSDEEFLGLKRKVRGICLRPGDMGSVTSNKRLSNEKQESGDQVQGTNCGTKEEHLQPENVKDDECLKDGSVTMKMCKPGILEDVAGVEVTQETGLAKKGKHEPESYPNNSLPISDAHDQEEECVLSGSFSPNVENMDGAKPKVPSVKSQDICSASSVNTPTLSSLDKSVDLPFADEASRNALTSAQSPESIGKVLTEMGPPLPPVVLPLTATPPKFRKHLTPNRPSIQLPTWSSTEGQFSLNQQPNVPSPDPGLQDEVKTSMTFPSPTRGVPSSPLQFGSATPKHALPVPGRLPSSALNSSSPSASQENSMQMLDTMYPELSAQARTLNILRGNVNLGRAANESGASPPSVNPISGNKTINSSSTAFTKTDQKAKRTANMLLPKSAKKLRLDTCSPDASSLTPPVQHVSDQPSNGVASPTHYPTNSPPSNNQTASKEGKTVDDVNDAQSLIFSAFEKLQNSCFDVLPVIRSHVFLGRISEVPVLRDEEKCVISDFCSKQVNGFFFFNVFIYLFSVHVIQIHYSSSIEAQ